MSQLKGKYAANRPGTGRMRESLFSPPVLVGENIPLHDEEFAAQRYAHKFRLENERATFSKWRSCPHCRLAGYLALFVKGHPLREHLRDHVLAQRLDLPMPIPDHAKRFSDLRDEQQAQRRQKAILKSNGV